MWFFGKKAKPEKVRDGLYSLMDDAWRLEFGPRLVEVVIGREMPVDFYLNECGAGVRYLKDMRDATGRKIESGETCVFHTWKDRSLWVWYLYRKDGGAWIEEATFAMSEEKALEEARKRVK